MVLIGIIKFGISCISDIQNENEKADQLFTWQSGINKIIQINEMGSLTINTPDINQSYPIRYKGYIPFALYENDKQIPVISTGSVLLNCTHPNYQNYIATIQKNTVIAHKNGTSKFDV